MALGATVARADVNEKVKEMTPPKDSKEFAMRAAEGNLFEVKLAQLAQQKGQSDRVKQVARTIERDHQQANDKLKQVAQSKNINLPTDLKGEKQECYEAFQKLDGKTFDENYLVLMIKDHLCDIMAFKNESQNGTDPDIKRWASETLPHLKSHGSQISQVAAATDIPVDVLASGGRMGEATPAGARQGPAGSPDVGRDTGTSDTGKTGGSGTSSGAGRPDSNRR
jgi:putative membrane protein